MKYNLSVSEVKSLSGKYNLIPLYSEILSDTETPVSIFTKLNSGIQYYSYLLESVIGGERWSRYSFISTSPKWVFGCKKKDCSLIKIQKSINNPVPETQVYSKTRMDNPVDMVKQIISKYRFPDIPGLPRFCGGAVGYIGYEMVHNFENISVPEKIDKLDSSIPDTVLMFSDTLVIFDHFSYKTKVVAYIDLTENKNVEQNYELACIKINDIINRISSVSNYEGEYSHEHVKNVTKNKKWNIIISNVTKQEYMNRVVKAKEYIYAGDIIQAVLSQRFSKKTFAKPFDIYRSLRTVNPSPYMYYLNLGQFQIIGSSPEILVNREGSLVEIRPIAGTRPRGANSVEEKKFETELLNSDKEKAEHIMLVDLSRNDIGRVCDYGSVKVQELMMIERYSHVIHLVSSVTGKLKKNMDSFDLFRVCFPAGTVSGAPKIRAMEIISELEKTTRGIYAGAVGYFSYNGNMDMAITIRTILFKNDTAFVQAGAGLVADSVPEKEYIESQNKAKALFKSIELAEQYYKEKIS